MNASELHQAIMNLPVNHAALIDFDSDEDRAYRDGHRDARHAAAELVQSHFKERDRSASEIVVDGGKASINKAVAADLWYIEDSKRPRVYLNREGKWEQFIPWEHDTDDFSYPSEAAAREAAREFAEKCAAAHYASGEGKTKRPLTCQEFVEKAPVVSDPSIIAALELVGPSTPATAPQAEPCPTCGGSGRLEMLEHCPDCRQASNTPPAQQAEQHATDAQYHKVSAVCDEIAGRYDTPPTEPGLELPTGLNAAAYELAGDCRLAQGPFHARQSAAVDILKKHWRLGRQAEVSPAVEKAMGVYRRGRELVEEAAALRRELEAVRAERDRLAEALKEHITPTRIQAILAGEKR